MYMAIGDIYTKHGMPRQVIWRDEHYAIAEVHGCGRVINYEAWIIQRHDAYEIGGKTIDAGECPPATSMWGRKGWTHTTEQQASDKIEALRREAAA